MRYKKYKNTKKYFAKHKATRIKKISLKTQGRETGEFQLMLRKKAIKFIRHCKSVVNIKTNRETKQILISNTKDGSYKAGYFPYMKSKDIATQTIFHDYENHGNFILFSVFNRKTEKIYRFKYFPESNLLKLISEKEEK